VPAVAIACPHCDYRINLKSPKPGRYRPRCPKCAKAFALFVPTDANESCAVRAILNDPEATDADQGRFGHQRLSDIEMTPAPRSKLVAPPPAEAPANSHLFELANTTPDPRKAEARRDPAKPVDPVAPKPDEDYAPPRADVRGYRIERELGRGGMGAVYLARQLSLDRPVALKVMSKRWANDPIFVARFTREAFAAAQLSHPNIVQIHDIGEVDGVRFFSMEFVPGRSLAEIAKKHGKLDPETAVGYVLQAARGLKHAHERGMIHRDVKPDNLLLDEGGLVKVADLGLVKTGNSEFDSRHAMPGRSGHSHSDHRPTNVDLTGVRIALGTPAYMSPEQCRDAAMVDHRADIYSLGCTLYVLVTGRPPFEGTTAVELMTKHAYEPLVPPEQIVARVPKELSAVIQRMMAKNAEDRFGNMTEVIRTLEAWLGVQHSGTFCPQEEQISKLEEHVHRFNTAATAVLRRRVLSGSFSFVIVIGVLLLFFGKLPWALGLFGLVTQGALAYFAVDGIARKGVLFTRMRQFVFGLGRGDLLIAGAALILFVLLLWMFGVLWHWIGFGLAGVGLAFAVRYGLDRKVEDERREPIDSCERLLRKLRMHGLDEEDLRQFVAKFAGRNWEEFYEAMFGYESKLAVRAVILRGVAAGPRERYASWREPLLHAIDRIEKSRKEARERKLLQAVEHARLVAAGLAQQEAECKAKAAADAIVKEAEKIRNAEADRVRSGPSQQVSHAAASVGSLMHGASNPDFVFEPARRDYASQVLGLFVGPHIRAILAAVLLASCGMWVYQNGLIPGAQAQAAAAIESQDVTGLQEGTALDASRATQPLRVEGIAPPLTAWADSFNVGLAGLMLLGSLFYRGNTMSLFVLLGAAVAVTGHRLGIRSVEPLNDYHIALLLGMVLSLVGFRLGTR